ncbi:MAG: glycolate oxidase subunit GlcD [Candidatus Schekmanbacteria bacterium RIFCSPHIGHO2_02_FULL_38_11]|uniref:Glycolate oxidase subunit GlcD n=1 Tax=Candidatus Schekmanbacteria bacterium RIFCSPLOWO2_12_FULL_38_15 TaxID=1817883 RepID=A0A1F7SHR1_9BACT|nr:MAG: glycolate oxidase subunit GlcD [Candidatus Schekmanbacteria bacterium GWA2_38_9]OGL50894.1 MAG: glycolate oxidase subunit GlcD [Candidatus Schekmanbacteria bacterium RIFCSPLOWO2_02_FULL_38_14]OGL53346.1 MAG: glycolate oxidase subunit GlcD [Candidatus Schekmanbacteria bacterium RIFCSPLOWO2_12_FULL_38_15]OGL54769.1 MAG: glycolate oxidase subunit GlcD [Candidatus Schekmanbacteria bacterium RIFCSPHIGHO2_02_FULL_38_11]
MITPKILKEIESIVGKDDLLTEKEDRICYSYDATNLKFLPEAIIFPQNTEEISRILKIANREKIPVFPRGAGSGFSGGSLPVNGGVVLATSKMDRILELDEENLTVDVEPGVVTEKLQKFVEAKGLFYPPDPASLKFSTIGGNIAECSGGPRALKYGVTRDYVLGLEIVLPTGEIMSTGAKTAKSVVGYDLTRLMVGSEGTLGIITKATLRLIPLPEEKNTLLVLFKKIEAAALAVTNIIKSRVIPSTLEFMDSLSIKCVEDYLGLGLPEEAGALLLIEIDGFRGSVEIQGNKIAEICKTLNPVYIKIAVDLKEQENLWQARRTVSPAIAKLSPTKVNEDITVPRNKIPEMLERIQKIADDFKLKIVCFGHAGDGNIHVNIMTDRGNKEEMECVEEAVKRLFFETLEIGGTISGEHGIGLTKAPYLKMEIGDIGYETMKKIKNLIDPNNILNPGKMFL